ncbi:MAG: STAS-like domain-containing protein, partial [Candidatus Margulisbacteria bacterium]|nr:STAS-like domain-containing protein [Candidatus Margulisiibacteriota bacterium]
SPRHLNEVFEQYANQADNSDLGFDKTLIQVKLYTIGGVHVSRSQARRILSGLDKFKIILFDFNKVPLVGQAFADEIFRVFHNKHPDIRLETENMNEGVRFMVGRAQSTAKRQVSWQ